MNLSEYVQHDAMGLAELVSSKQVSAEELVRTCVAAIKRVNPQINAICQDLSASAMEAARGALPAGPFSGVPFLLKDIGAALAGTRMGGGSAFLEGSPVADHDSELVSRYKRAGLVIVGKTTTPEFGACVSTEPALTGLTHNPWNLQHSSGGSSGGASAATAAGIVPCAHGGDGGGSLRVPAACCHLFAVKPTRQRLPTGPDMGDAFFGFSVAHVVSHSVRDNAAMLDATCGPDVGAPYWAPPLLQPFLADANTDPPPLRIAPATRHFAESEVHDECAQAAQDAAQLCEALGHGVEEAQPTYDWGKFISAIRAYLFGGIASAVRQAGRDLGRTPSVDNIEWLTWQLMEDGSKNSAVDFIHAAQFLGALGRRIGRFYEQYDVLLTPSMAQPPVVLGYLKNDTDTVDDYLRKTTAYLPFQPLANATGQPAATLPFAISADGLPLGVHFMTRLGDEATLFQLAAQIERARPWRHLRPPVHAAA